jgi:signal transduction histidine kinase
MASIASVPQFANDHDWQNHAAMLTGLSSFIREALEHPTKPGLLATILKRCGELFDTPHAVFDVISPDGNFLVDECATGLFAQKRLLPIRIGEGIAGTIWKTGRPLTIDNYRDWEGKAPGVPTELRAAMAAPVLSDGAVIGVILVAIAASDRTFTSQDLALLQMIADLSAALVTRQRRENTIQRERDAAALRMQKQESSLISVRNQMAAQIADRNARLNTQNNLLTALNDITLQLINETSWQTLLESLIGHTKTLLTVPHAFIAMIDASRHVMVDVVRSTIDMDWNSEKLRGEGLKGLVWETGETVVVDNYAAHPRRAPEPELDTLRATAIAPLVRNGQVIGALGVAHTDPARRFSDDEINALNRFAQLASLAYDRTRLLQSERRNRLVAESLRDVLRLINTTQSLDEVLGFVFHQMTRLLDMPCGMMFRLNPQNNELTIQQFRGIPKEAADSFKIIVSPATLLRARRYQRTSLVLPPTVTNLLIAGIMRHPEMRKQFSSVLPGIQSAIAAQLASHDQIYGGVLFFKTDNSGFDVTDMTAMRTLASHASLAIANSQLRIQSMTNAAEEERSRLARDLHDSVSQALFGIALGAQTALELHERGSPSLTDPLNYVMTLAEAALAEMRALIFQLRPDMLERGGLLGAIELQAAALRARHHLKVTLTISMQEPPVALDLKEAIYRVVSEALHNIVKHARATQVSIDVHDRNDGCEIVITDDGMGFDPAVRRPASFGLRVMRERMTALGGDVIIDSTLGGGTRVNVRAPIKLTAPLAVATHGRPI